ncbi:MAG: TrkA C-terminal domain-containing protein [Oscillospiraceae bacterium]
MLDIPIPEDFNIVSITRDGELLIPCGQTILRSGDQLVCVTLGAALHTVVREWRLPNI